jgi:hypothetical protein
MTPEEYNQAQQQLQNESLDQFPSTFQMARNLMKQAWLSGTGFMQGKPFLATPEKSYARLEICKTCEFFKDTRCLKCGCYMEKKAHLEMSQCPINKWGDLQTPFQPNKNLAPSEMLARMGDFSESERTEILAIAEDSIINFDGRFTFNKKHYFAKRAKDTNNIVIFEMPPRTVKVARKDPLMHCQSQFSDMLPEEKAAFDALIQQTRTAGNTSFVYKGSNVLITPADNELGYTLSTTAQEQTP